MNQGLEIGIDPDSGKPIRLKIESNLASMAPPRSGKTAGFIVPNLLAADAKAWAGPAVVIDPKGEVYRTVARRRRQLGRRVVRLDFRRGVKGSDRWNPLAGLDPEDVERLQNIGRALVARSGPENQYFSDRGVDIFAGTIASALSYQLPKPNPAKHHLPMFHGS